MNRQADLLRRFIGGPVPAPAAPTRGHLVAIGSGKGGTGASLLTALLALGTAAAGARTLLVDADLAFGIQHRLFGLGETPGLAALAGEADAEALCTPLTTDLDLLAGGGARSLRRPAARRPRGRQHSRWPGAPSVRRQTRGLPSCCAGAARSRRRRLRQRFSSIRPTAFSSAAMRSQPAKSRRSVSLPKDNLESMWRRVMATPASYMSPPRTVPRLPKPVSAPSVSRTASQTRLPIAASSVRPRSNLPTSFAPAVPTATPGSVPGRSLWRLTIAAMSGSAATPPSVGTVLQPGRFPYAALPTAGSACLAANSTTPGHAASGPDPLDQRVVPVDGQAFVRMAAHDHAECP